MHAQLLSGHHDNKYIHSKSREHVQVELFSWYVVYNQIGKLL